MQGLWFRIRRVLTAPAAWLARHGVRDVMLFLVIGMAGVLVLDFMGLHGSMSLAFSKPLILRGQVWRLVSFILLPISSGNLLFTALALYFYFFIGRSLENAWGTTQFLNYYLCGMLFQILSGMLLGVANNTYINLSLFLAFAALYPDEQVMLFFILPVKIKWLAWLDVALQAYMLIVGSWPTRLAIAAGLANFLIFFGGPMIRRIKNDSRYWETRQKFRRTMRGK